MTSVTIFLAIAGVAVMVFWISVGVWMGTRFTQENRRQTDHVKQFLRNEDMSTDGEL